MANFLFRYASFDNQRIALFHRHALNTAVWIKKAIFPFRYPLIIFLFCLIFKLSLYLFAPTLLCFACSLPKSATFMRSYYSCKLFCLQKSLYALFFCVNWYAMWSYSCRSLSISISSRGLLICSCFSISFRFHARRLRSIARCFCCNSYRFRFSSLSIFRFPFSST